MITYNHAHYFIDAFLLYCLNIHADKYEYLSYFFASGPFIYDTKAKEIKVGILD